MKEITPIVGVAGHNQPAVLTGVIPTGGYTGWADNMGFVGIII